MVAKGLSLDFIIFFDGERLLAIFFNSLPSWTKNVGATHFSGAAKKLRLGSIVITK